MYAHIATQDDEPDKLAVQYWFYWYFNDWNNKHESDWEGIQLLFDVGTVEEALQAEPVSTGYAQHEGGERADWDSSKLERDGSRPFVYPSAGSHASYYGSALYLGRSASEGFGCDTTDGPSVRTDPSVVLLPTSVSGPDDDLAWLGYNGRWGERQSGPFNGPTGPPDKERWSNPVDWHEELRAESVVVPSGDSQGDVIINTFCGVVAAGSGALVTLQTSPLTLVAMIAVLFFVAKWLIGRTVWNEVSVIPMVARRRAGEIIRAAANSYRRRAGVLITIGLVYLPAAVVVGLFAALLQPLPVLRQLTQVSGTASGTGFVFAVLVGELGERDGLRRCQRDGRRVLRPAGERRRRRERCRRGTRCVVAPSRPGGRVPLVVPDHRLLLLSVLGIPVALWLLVRFQFLAQAVVTEGHGGRGALRRSAALVRGRWWHTALLVGLFNLLVGVSALVTGLLLLVVAAGIPLWLFSALISLVNALIVPLAAVAMTLLFGDAVAEAQGLGVDDDPDATSEVAASGSFAHR